MRVCRAKACPRFAAQLRWRGGQTSTPIPSQSQSKRRYATEAVAAAQDEENHQRATLHKPSQARYNDLGVQHISDHVHSQIFTGAPNPPPAEYIELSKDHLSRHDLLGKNQERTAPVAFDMPVLQGSSLDEHFYRVGMDASEPYLTLAKQLVVASPPPKPRKWVRRSGWTKYLPDGSSEAVEAPEESAISFDTEVMWKETSFPAMACAVSATAWYGWLSPWLLGESESDRHLIPLGDPKKPRVVVGHNIGYDRARVREEYDLAQTKNFYMDTMSLHVAVNGMCTRQRPTWMKHRKARDLREDIANSMQGADLHALLKSGEIEDEEEHLWIGRSSVNSLRDVAKFHCGVTIDKTRREDFGELDRAGVMSKYDELLDYCAADVDITHRVYRKVFPAFLETCPHPVSFAALRHLSSVILPVNETWEQYLDSAETTYHEMLDAVKQRLVKLTDKALEKKDDPTAYENDPWLSQLDWSGQEIKMAKPKKKGEEPRPVKRQKKPGMPAWYKGLFASNDSPMNLTVRTRIAPLLLRLAWEGNPLIWSDKHGWTFRVTSSEAVKYRGKGMEECDMNEEENPKLRLDSTYVYFKLPHKDGPAARCANPLAKGYLQHFESGTLASEYPYAKEALEMNASCSYWISTRDRIRSQMVVYNRDIDSSTAPSDHNGYILPQLVPMGTITRRAVENTWLTASNAKKNRVGSELKSMIRAPPGYCFVGADVDSQELWIASLMGDAQFKQHGGNAIGFMTLEGTKAAGTDLHSRTAEILGISRNDAKVFNYGRIYGAGLNFASTLLKQFNPTLTTAEAATIAAKLYASTKGTKQQRKALRKRGFWRGGTESLVFNVLEDFAEQDKPRTPVLGAGITEALMRRFISRGEFMTSRVNWAIQSSGVDYLHLLIVAMDYMIRRYALDGVRLAITVHDEIRYLVPQEMRYKAALALQVANVWTRAMFAQQCGIDDLPQQCAFFSAIDVDHVLRKEVDMDCVTPSHKVAIPPGESLDIVQLLDKGDVAALDAAIVPDPNEQPRPERFEYAPREPVVKKMLDETHVAYLKAQIASSEDELRRVIKDYREPELSSSGSSLEGALKSPSSSSSSSGSTKRTRKPASTPTTPSTTSTTTRPKGKPGPKPKPAPKQRQPVLRKMETPKRFQPQGIMLPEAPWDWLERHNARGGGGYYPNQHQHHHHQHHHQQRARAGGLGNVLGVGAQGLGVGAGVNGGHGGVSGRAAGVRGGV